MAIYIYKYSYHVDWDTAGIGVSYRTIGGGGSIAPAPIDWSLILANYYTKTEMQSYRSSLLHYSNIDWNGMVTVEIVGQSIVTGRLSYIGEIRVQSVVLGSSTQQDFTVTPYLQVLNFNATLVGTNLTLTCTVKAPIITGLPNFYEVKGFLSLTTFCGNANYINIGDYNNLRKQINKTWAAEVGAADSKDYSLGPFPVKSGYTYYVRIGANVNALSRRYNYSPILKVVVP